jgi:hypothetical protein
MALAVSDAVPDVGDAAEPVTPPIPHVHPPALIAPQAAIRLEGIL